MMKLIYTSLYITLGNPHPIIHFWFTLAMKLRVGFVKWRSRISSQTFLHKAIWICLSCLLLSLILYGIILTTLTSGDTASITSEATSASVASTSTITLIETTVTTLLPTASTATTIVTATTPAMTTSLEALGEYSC